MNSLSQRTRSVWMADVAALDAPLERNVATEIAIVGAGLGGLTTAYLLAREGHKVTVIDAGAPGGGMTARTTAHLASALDERWYELIDLRGEKEACIAAEAHVAAI